MTGQQRVSSMIVMALQEFARGVPSSNLVKDVEIKPVIIIKFKLIMKILSHLNLYKIVIN